MLHEKYTFLSVLPVGVPVWYKPEVEGGLGFLNKAAKWCNLVHVITQIRGHV